MRKTVSVALFVILLISAIGPTFAQRSKSAPAPVARDIQFERIDAYTSGRGVFLRWEMKSETGNLGFDVRRLTEKGSEPVNKTLILSWTARTRRHAADYDRVYDLFDPKGNVGSRYIIQGLGLDGSRPSTDLVKPRFTDSIEAVAGVSEAVLQNAAESNNGDIQREFLSLSKETDGKIQASASEADLNTHRWVVSQPGVKIAVRNEGVYRVGCPQLQGAGFNTGGNSANWRLFAEGVEQAIIVGSGDRCIEFLGKGIDTPESDTRIYYLIADTSPGKRIETRVLRGIGGNALANSYRITAEKKERNTYVGSILNGPAENYWGRAITSLPPEPGFEITFNLTGVDVSAANFVLSVKMQGQFGDTHAVKVVLNGQQIGTVSGFSTAVLIGNFTVPSNFFVEGTNRLALTENLSTSSSLFDSVSVNYSRKYQADQNKVSFSTPGYRRVDLTGFTTANVRVFDTSQAGSPQQIVNLAVEQSSGTYTVKIPANRPSVYFGVEDSAVLQSPDVTANNPSTLSGAGNGARLVIISHSAPDFMAAAEAWANYRRSPGGGGFTVKVVDVADIFDEYNYGSASADSINAFLTYTYSNWQPNPQYVLLLGDGSYDPRNYEGFGYLNTVPSKIIATAFEETASDEALADFNSDGFAEMAVGRISAATAANITTALNKTMSFETPTMQSLSRGALFAYDVPSGYDFEQMSQTLRSQLAPNVPTTMIGRGLPPPNQFTQDPMAQPTLLTAMNTGKYIVNYSGHGASGIWATPNFFGVSNVPQLTNANNQSIFTMLTCLNGYFIRPVFDSLSESLIKSPTGGAVAVWSSTGTTSADVQLVLGTRFYSELNTRPSARIGELIRDAKSVIPAGSDVRLSWGLMGDPMLKVK